MAEYNINNSVGFLGAMVSQALGIKLRKNFKKHGIDLPISQFEVLFTLYHKDGLCQQELSVRLLKDKAAIKRTVDNLCKKELVRRAQSTVIKNNSVFLTGKARQMESEIKSIASATLEEGIAGIDTLAYQSCLEVLRTIYKNNIICN